MDKKYVLRILGEILQVDSPTGYTKNMVNKLKEIIEDIGYNVEINNRENCIIQVEGKNKGKTLLCAHMDTLGLIVKEIKSSGALAISRIGAPVFPSMDSENCKIYTRKGTVYKGTIISTSPSAHVNKDYNTLERNEDNLEVRVDEIVRNKEDVKKLGISNGDFICIDTKTEILDNGYIKSRFLDDKLSVAILIGLLKYYKDNNIKPKNTLKIIFSNSEEVGKAISGIDEEIEECIAVDMGCVGKGLECTEQMVSICAKDSGGPYNYDMISKLVQVAENNNINYATDVYSFYTSDITVILKSGKDIRGVVIGPGVYASHGYERSHIDAVSNTFNLILNYLK